MSWAANAAGGEAGAGAGGGVSADWGSKMTDTFAPNTKASMGGQSSGFTDLAKAVQEDIARNNAHKVQLPQAQQPPQFAPLQYQQPQMRQQTTQMQQQTPVITGFNL